MAANFQSNPIGKHMPNRGESKAGNARIQITAMIATETT
jgi:hypothetical protein